ncbi:c-type cytochrome [Altericroceibacterium xinjiangense]|uniref:c-type cytochrome n=1 Tax=Altericroceibacterium xinjiangense TaxID=762261 RepID=UPI000F7EB887|nr:c-type cytochrome [Altericroceibacterium xinjiangense]
MQSTALRKISRLFAAGGLALAASSCSPNPEPSRFDDTGQLVALSGGNAGAQSACHTCHGLDGAGDGNLTPRLAGLEAGYLARQMIFFSDGLRHHAAMSWIASQLTSEQRMIVADYYAGMEWQPADLQPAVNYVCDGNAARLYQLGDPARGIEACATCHGEDGRGVGFGNPDIYGQPAPYVATQLRHWREGERYGDPMGVMLREAQRLEEDEIKPLADYVASLRGMSRRPGYREGCPEPRRPDSRNGA